MSGICGIINLNDKPVDQQLLKDMTDFMAYRGPDAQDIWINGKVGFGHAMLRTTFEAEHEKQPCSLDGHVWITADARIDGQADLKKKLQDKGRRGLDGATDAELILHAYHAWGEDCLAHLIGDFAFAIWDGHKQSLFCARDHFGVKLFYYANKEETIVFSNTLNCVRRHPDVSDVLNDHAIADFLLFDRNYDPATTTFADIRSIPPAHFLTWSKGTLRVNGYWELTIPETIHYKHSSDYVERFTELFRTSMQDRLRTNRVKIEMSGGLDSSFVAATALDILKNQGQDFQLSAQTIVYDRLIPDKERYYAGLVADHLDIPIYYLVADNYKLFDQSYAPKFHWPEPVQDICLGLYLDEFMALSANNRVVLTGWDGEAVLNEPPLPYLQFLLKKRKINRLTFKSAWLIINRPHRVLKSIATRLGRKPGKSSRKQETLYPPWINKDFEARMEMTSRWDRINAPQAKQHPVRPYADRIFTSTQLWLGLLEAYDAGVSHFPLEFRHPFLDLRLVEFCLALPPVPWCFDKELLRVAMKGLVPEQVRHRPKSPLAGLPYMEQLKQGAAKDIDDFSASAKLAEYVDIKSIPKVSAGADPNTTWINMRPLSLNLWLQSF